ncbi:MAG: T9SS type A sorting domain-containing protein, partial [Saprospiraceae bacterium]
GEVSNTFNDTIWQKLNNVLCDISAVSNAVEDNDLNFFPNPAQQSFSINVKEGYFDFIMTDITGKIVRKEEHAFDMTKVDCSDLPGGVYYISVNAGGKRFTRKIVVQ